MDFGFDLPSDGEVAVGSRVWADDGDGIFQIGEGVVGAVGVTVVVPVDRSARHNNNRQG